MLASKDGWAARPGLAVTGGGGLAAPPESCFIQGGVAVALLSSTGFAEGATDSLVATTTGGVGFGTAAGAGDGLVMPLGGGAGLLEHE